jgi:hypothetical protein
VTANLLSLNRWQLNRSSLIARALPAAQDLPPAAGEFAGGPALKRVEAVRLEQLINVAPPFGFRLTE